jgi:hypothetical protein
MTTSNGTTQACAQADAPKNLATHSPQTAIELQARKLRQQFALSPETARTVASLAFVAKVRA